MTRDSRHNRLTMAVSLLASLAAVLAVLLAPLSAAFAGVSAPGEAHACCKEQTSEPSEHCAPSVIAPGNHAHPDGPCECHVMPDTGVAVEAAAALTSSTHSFDPAVAAQNNLQVDIPLAREPDDTASARHATFQPAAPPLYLLNSVLLL